MIFRYVWEEGEGAGEGTGTVSLRRAQPQSPSTTLEKLYLPEKFIRYLFIIGKEIQ